MNPVEEKIARMRKVLRLERPDRLPMGDYKVMEYRPDLYHLGEIEQVEAGQVKVSADGKKVYTRDGGVWKVGDREVYRDEEDVLNVDTSKFVVEEVGPEMLNEMARLYRETVKVAFPVAWHYGTLVTRATIEFGWEPFLLASRVDPDRFGEICACFGEASLAVARGWARTEGVEFVVIHDDIAATRGVILSPEWYRQYVFPWHKRIFDAIHAGGKKVLYLTDGNYLEVMDDILAQGPDGVYIESTSMDPAEVMRRGGPGLLYLLKSDTRNLDWGTPDDVKREILKLRDLHQRYPGIFMYMGGNRKPECVEAFRKYYKEYLVYGQ